MGGHPVAYAVLSGIAVGLLLPVVGGLSPATVRCYLRLAGVLGRRRKSAG